MPSLRHIEVLERSRVKHGYRIAVLTNWYKGRPYKYFEKQYLLNESEGAALFCLGQTSGLTATDICEITGRPKNSISRALTVLLSRKLIVRTADVRDKRRKLLDLTPEGFRIFKDVEEEFVASERKMLSALDPAEMETLDRLLSKMIHETVKWARIY